MSYIGRGLDKISNIEKLDTITFDGSSSYTLQKNSVNFTPNSANSLQVSIDGVVQAGNFTVSGSTIDFGVAIPATSTNDFIFHYGTGVAFTPADGTVTTAKLADGSVTSAKLSGVTQGITMADQWRLTADVTANESPLGSSATLERPDDATFAKIGTGMTESSGVFTFPSTGLYEITSYIDATPSNDTISIQALVSSDSGSNYDSIYIHYTGGNTYRGGSTRSGLVNVTNATTFRIKFDLSSVGASSTVHGDTDQNETHFMFKRLGDSQ